MKRKFDHDAIAKDIQGRVLRQEQIAHKYKCSRNVIVRVAREMNIHIGQGIRYTWNFSNPSPELAYIVGMYLTEGTIGLSHTTRKPNQFIVCNSSDILLNRVSDCISAIGLKPHRRKWYTGGIGTLPKSSVACYSVQFVRWLYDVCNVKNAIPAFVFDSPLDNKLAFVASLIDGDGCVQKNGTIRMRATQDWMKQLPDLLLSMNIRSGGIRIARILDSGKPYYSVSINRMDFRSMNGQLYCHDPEKQRRILFGKEPPWSSRIHKS